MFGMTTPYRHPANNPNRMNTDFTMKAPKPPDRPLVPYMRYSRKMWQKVRAENPEAQLWDIGKIIGQLWRDASDTEKQVYQQEFEMEKAEYEKAMKSYHSSQAYQHYVNAKNRAKNNEKTSRGRADMGGVVIQPVDEEDVANDLTSRRLAAVRFDRNHRLISEVFSPVIVNDARTIVAQTRIDMLRNQAKSLSNHQGKLEEELAKLEADYNDRKRIISKNSEDFVENLKKVCEEKPKLDEDKFNELINDWTGKLLEAYEDYKKKQEEISAKQAADREKMEKETPVLAGLVMRDDEEDKSEKSTRDDEPMEQDNPTDSTVKSVPEEEQKVSSSTDDSNKKTEDVMKPEPSPVSTEKSLEKTDVEESSADEHTMEVDAPPADAPDSSEKKDESEATTESATSSTEQDAVELIEPSVNTEAIETKQADTVEKHEKDSNPKENEELKEPVIQEKNSKEEAEAIAENETEVSQTSDDLKTAEPTEEKSPNSDTIEEKSGEKDALVEEKKEEETPEEKPAEESSTEVAEVEEKTETVEKTETEEKTGAENKIVEVEEKTAEVKKEADEVKAVEEPVEEATSAEKTPEVKNPDEEVSEEREVLEKAEGEEKKDEPKDSSPLKEPEEEKS